VAVHLYLVQHGKALSKAEDPERPLSDNGREEVRRVAGYVNRRTDILIRQINHSGKTRARQTAELLAEAIQPPEGVNDVPDLAPLDDPSVWVSYLAETTRDLMLVGHLPNLSKLAALLICQDETKKVVDFQMGGVVCLSRDEDGRWAVRWMVTPDIVA
jgi:phosphohistidine phosphatase